MELCTLFTPNQIVEMMPGLRLVTLRGWLNSRASNGLGPHVYKVGSRIMIDGRGFKDWIEEEAAKNRAGGE